MRINNFKVSIIFFLFLYNIKVECGSFVYNMKVKDIVRQHKIDPGVQNKEKPFIAELTILSEFFKFRNNLNTKVLGGLATFVYNPNSYYLEVDFAVANVKQRDGEFEFSQTQADDILFSGGYAVETKDKKVKVGFTGMLGIPTHKDLIFEFGTGHFGIGAQIGCSFSYSEKNPNNLIMTAVRLVHFFPNKLEIPSNNEILKFRFDLGNVTDLIFIHVNNWGNHSLEVGYNPAFFSGANISPMLEGIVENINLARSSFYAAYDYKLTIDNFENVVGVGFAYGFNHSRNFGIKNAYALWGTWVLIF